LPCPSHEEELANVARALSRAATQVRPAPSRRSSVQHRCHVAATQVRTEAAQKGQQPSQSHLSTHIRSPTGSRTCHVARKPPLRERANQSFSYTPSSGLASDWSAQHRYKSSPSSSNEKRRHGKPLDHALHAEGRTTLTEISEKRSSKESNRKRRSGDSSTPRSPRRERDDHHTRDRHYHKDTLQSRGEYRSALIVEVPEVYHREAQLQSASSSQEALLNPRPHRSQHTRQRHPKRSSQVTLRGRGAKRDPPQQSRTKKSLRPEPSQGWSLFAPSPPKTPQRGRNHRDYQTLQAWPSSHRCSREHRSTTPYHASPESSRSQTRHHRSRGHERQTSTLRPARSRTPNIAARRVPDRRFAVLAATNEALENVRREAFAQSSPPPRRERLRRFEEVTVPTSQIPFNWDCVSSSQTSARQGHGDSSGSRRRRARR
ncbi:hypothetical protein J1614_007877, partial [Plenodomus biglobosus]